MHVRRMILSLLTTNFFNLLKRCRDSSLRTEKEKEVQKVFKREIRRCKEFQSSLKCTDLFDSIFTTYVRPCLY